MEKESYFPLDTAELNENPKWTSITPASKVPDPGLRVPPSLLFFPTYLLTRPCIPALAL